MQVTIDHQDGTETAYFGVSDFPGEPTDDDEGIKLCFFRTGRDIPEPLELRGVVDRAVSEQAFPTPEAIEHLAHIAPQEGTSVFVVPTNHNEHIVEAVEELQREDEFEHGDSLTIHR